MGCQGHLVCPFYYDSKPGKWSTFLPQRSFWETDFLPLLGAKKSTQTFFVQSFSTTLRVMDVHAANRGRPHQFPAALLVGRNFLTPGHPGVRVRNVCGKSGPKSLCLCFFSSLNYWCWRAGGAAPVKTNTWNNFPRKYQRIPRNDHQYWC